MNESSLIQNHRKMKESSFIQNHSKNNEIFDKYNTLL